MNYQARVKKHMAEYKRNALCIEENGTWRQTPYAHILPKEKRELNIISRYKEEFYQSNFSKIKYHRHFHHLNSSQAMCINFFFPLVQESKLETFLNLLGFENEEVDYDRIRFEMVSGVDKTNFDFYIRLLSGKEIFFEIKYTESTFGSVKRNQSHEEKFNKTYRPILKNLSFISDGVMENAADVNLFLSQYQLLRNLVHIGDHRYVVFVYPRTNKQLHGHLNRGLKELAGSEWAERCNVMVNHCSFASWENLTEALIKQLELDPLAHYYQDFTEKYLEIDDPVLSRCR